MQPTKIYTANNYIKRLLMVVVCIYSSAIGVAQSDTAYLVKEYDFIVNELNTIENENRNLRRFYQKMFLLENERLRRLNIAHVGDSHLQADMFSGEVRQLLQLRFGNAGRGFVYPYHVAKSNEPASYNSYSNAAWEAKRNAFPNQPLPIGIGAFTIETKDSTATLGFNVKDQPGLGYQFSKLTLFHEKDSAYSMAICLDTACDSSFYINTDTTGHPFASTYVFDAPAHKVLLKSYAQDSSALLKTRIYGTLLENDSVGVLYNMIGANGAKYTHYVNSAHFIEQFAYLKSDLVIFSMGTNEGYKPGINPAEFYRQMDSLLVDVRKTNPNAAIILTTPPDSYRMGKSKRIKNPDMRFVRLTIINYCLQHKLPYWDLHEVMGGVGSMDDWLDEGLAAHDKVHFTAKGYQLQGRLLYYAIMRGYNNFIIKKRK